MVDTITSLQDVEAQHISQLLQEYDNNRRQVAETLEDLRNCSI
jgi:transcriptional regulator with PAS, ATPase and Fis domain